MFVTYQRKRKMLNENQQELKYIVKVNGKVRTVALPKTLAEAAVQNLPESEQGIAVIVPVTDEGQELLLEN